MNRITQWLFCIETVYWCLILCVHVWRGWHSHSGQSIFVAV